METLKGTEPFASRGGPGTSRPSRDPLRTLVGSSRRRIRELLEPSDLAVCHVKSVREIGSEAAAGRFHTPGVVPEDDYRVALRNHRVEFKLVGMLHLSYACEEFSDAGMPLPLARKRHPGDFRKLPLDFLGQ